MPGKTTPAAIHQELTEIKKLLEQFEQKESTTKHAFTTLYTELEQYKKDFIYQLEKGILQDLLLFYDSLIWFQSSSGEDSESISENLAYLIDEFLEVLRRRDVKPYPVTEEFDPKLHQIIQTVTVDDKNKDHRIAQILKRGFYRGEQILRVEEVTINKYDPKATQKDDQ